MGRSTSAAAATQDGRLLRSERSRAAIVQALFDLVGEGTLQPTAEQVAERAGVGIRTVFRHFSDMESLFSAMHDQLLEAALPLLTTRKPEGTLTHRAKTLVSARIALFERIAPYKRSANVLRWRSEFLRTEHRAMVRRLRADLNRWLPELASAPEDLVEAIDQAASFEACDRLRTEQRLGRPRAEAAMRRGVLSLVDNL